jgi:hypothetical protein
MLRTAGNKGSIWATCAPTWSSLSEQAQKVRNRAIPEWAEGLYYNKGLFSEALVPCRRSLLGPLLKWC